MKGSCQKKAVSVLVVLLLTICFTGCRSADSVHDNFSGDIDEYIESFNKNVTDYKVNGTIIVAKDNNLVYKNSFGKADFENELDFTDETVFRIASVTKLFTSVAIMQLCEQGKLSLLDPISKFVPDQHRGDEITIHHLLTHTSGVSRESGVDPFRFNTKEDIISSIVDKPLLFDPGTDIEYSNGGYNLLAAVIEKVSGLSYSDYLNENIFIPAEMKRQTS